MMRHVLLLLCLLPTSSVFAQTHFEQATDGGFLGSAGPSSPLAWDQYAAGGGTGLIVISTIGDTVADVVPVPMVNGSPAFLIAKLAPGNGCSARWNYLHGALAPIAGANHIVITPTATTVLHAVSASYYGMTQAAPTAVTSACGHSATVSGTISAASSTSYLIAGGRNDYSTTGAQTGTVRLSSTTAGQSIGDSAVDGATSLTWKQPASQLVDWSLIVAAFGTTDTGGGGGGGGTPPPPFLACVLGQSNAVPLVAALRAYLSVIDCGTQGSTAIAAWQPHGILDPIPRIGVAPLQRVFIWQGESDASAALVATYATSLRAVIARIRVAVGNPTLSVVILSIAPPLSMADPQYGYREQIRAAQMTVAADPGNQFFDTTSYPYIPAGQLNGEHLTEYTTLAAALAALP